MISPLKRKKRPPFVVAYKAVLRSPKLSLEAKAVLLILKSYANSDGTHCFPSIKRLANDAHCSRRSINRHLNELKSAGMIFSEQRSTKGNQRSTSAYLIYDETHAKAARKPKKRSTDFGARPTTGLAHGSTPKIVPFTEKNEALR